MYWSEWGSANCIKRAALNGSQQTILVSNTGYAKYLTIDYDDRLLYWADVQSPAIYSVTLDGKHKKTIVQTKMNLMGLTMYKDKIYWTDSSTGNLIL